uniref:Uncharacterized protein n=1 Tax=Parascaris equorum TaxID=6256 RepID=A0A914RWK6_PAREQ
MKKRMGCEETPVHKDLFVSQTSVSQQVVSVSPVTAEETASNS